jgi:tRNA C32,U32 (ribose-2'-O)-methylase TrmJ
MVRNIRSVVLRADMTDQEVRTWRGIVKALAEGPKRKKP